MSDDNHTNKSSISAPGKIVRWVQHSYARRVIISIVVLLFIIVLNLTLLIPLGQNRFLSIFISMVFYVYILSPRDSTILTAITGIIFLIFHELVSDVFPRDLVSPAVPIIVFSAMTYILATSINRRRKLEQRVVKLAQFDEFALEGVCVLSKSVIVDHNFALMRILGKTGTELIGDSILDYIIEDEREIINTYMLNSEDFMLNTLLLSNNTKTEVTLFYRVFDRMKGTLSIIEKSKGDQYISDYQKFFGFYDTVSEIADIGIIERDMGDLMAAFGVLKKKGIKDLA